ncbi:MAG: DNA methyltransferase, partial [Vulcanimicrobiaceae bacterium]
MRRRTRPEPHADWLALVDAQGQFLTIPILRAAFPTGLDAVPDDVRAEARERLAILSAGAPSDDDRWAWIVWLLRNALGWDARYVEGPQANAFAHVLPEHRTELRAHGALIDPADGNRPRVLVLRVPYGTPFERRIAGSEWNASPLDRLSLLARAHGVRIGLVSDGARVALEWIPSEGAGGHAIWPTELFAEGAERAVFASFVSLLHARRFFGVALDDQLERLFERSALAQQDLTKTLGLQVRKAVELLVAAISSVDRDSGGAVVAGIPPHEVYKAAATVMMRLVFLLFAEERGLLPLADPLYAQSYAVSTLRDQLEADAVRLGDEPLERRATAWRRLLAIFGAVHGGIAHDRLRLPAYGGRLFDPARFELLARVRIDDLTIKAILEAIATIELHDHGQTQRRRLSFLALDVEQIGHVYEGLLDHDAVRVEELYVGLDGKQGLEPEVALAELEAQAARGRDALVAHLTEITRRSESAVRTALTRGDAAAAGEAPELRRLVMTACDSKRDVVERVLPFAALLRSDLHELPTIFPPGSLVVKQTRARRDSGTEYTPRSLAEEVVHYALEPLVYAPGPADGALPESWRLKPSDELLALRICDPACGSGAFLVAACRYLSDRVVEAWLREGRIADDDATREAQRAIVERCLYGVDRDGMAVEMAKLSLWLLTFAKERPFGFLDHAIREGDSLLGITSL